MRICASRWFNSYPHSSRETQAVRLQRFWRCTSWPQAVKGFSRDQCQRQTQSQLVLQTASDYCLFLFFSAVWIWEICFVIYIVMWWDCRALRWLPCTNNKLCAMTIASVRTTVCISCHANITSTPVVTVAKDMLLCEDEAVHVRPFLWKGRFSWCCNKILLFTKTGLLSFTLGGHYWALW